MDSNVSKTTFSHKFFKLRFAGKNDLISFEDLLQQNLLSALDLYRQKADFSLSKYPRATSHRDQIIVLRSFSGDQQFFLSSSGLSIIYSSSIALFLASQTQKSPHLIASELVDLLIFQTNNYNSEFNFKLPVTIAKSGWINFCLDSKIIAQWLEQSLIWLQEKGSTPVKTTQLSPLASTVPNLFPVQYVHARCCSWLRLAAREQLITIKAPSDRALEFWLPQSISWLDGQQVLWLTAPSAWNLLHQLLAISDWYGSTSKINWVKIAHNLCQTVAVFNAECPFLGRIRNNQPNQAIARLGLIALTQAWLNIILTEKLNVLAPMSL